MQKHLLHNFLLTYIDSTPICRVESIYVVFNCKYNMRLFYMSTFPVIRNHLLHRTDHILHILIRQ